MNIEPVPPESMVMPEAVEVKNLMDRRRLVMISPDPNTGAWISSTSTEQGVYNYALSIGQIISDITETFSVPIPESYLHTQVLIGWRPSDYSYSQG